MKVHMFTREQFVDRPIAEVFQFFSDAGNLERITPPWLRFHILTPRPIRMEPGALIDYRIRLKGLSVPWRSRIAVWEPPARFVDEQLRGPYRLWEHTHEFSSVADGTIVRDVVRYGMHGGWAGDVIQRAIVARDVARIFDYRRRALASIFPDRLDGDRRERRTAAKPA